MAKDEAEVERLLEEIRTINRDLAANKAEKTKRIDQAKADAARIKISLEAKRKKLEKKIRSYVSKNKGWFTDKKWKAKSKEFENGKVGWRLSARSIRVKKVELEGVISRLWKNLNTRKYVRRTVKYELNREALLQDHEFAETIDGITVVGGKRDSIFIDVTND